MIPGSTQTRPATAGTCSSPPDATTEPPADAASSAMPDRRISCTWTVEPPLSNSSGFGHLEVPQVAVVDGHPLLLFCTNAVDAVNRARMTASGSLPGPTVNGPWDLASARPFPHPYLYAPRLVPDIDGTPALIGFLDQVDGVFAGELTDPIRVRYDPVDGLIAEANEWALGRSGHLGAACPRRAGAERSRWRPACRAGAGTVATKSELDVRDRPSGTVWSSSARTGGGVLARPAEGSTPSVRGRVRRARTRVILVALLRSRPRSATASSRRPACSGRTLGPSAVQVSGRRLCAAIASSSIRTPRPGESPRMNAPSSTCRSTETPTGGCRSCSSLAMWFGTDVAACSSADRGVADRADRQVVGVGQGGHPQEVGDPPDRGRLDDVDGRRRPAADGTARAR